VEVTPKIPIPLKSLAQRYSLKRLGNTSEFSGYVDEHAGLILKTKSDNVIQLNYVADASKRIRCQSYYDDPLKFIAVVTHCPPVSLEGPSEAVPKMTLVWTISGGKIVNRSGRQMSLDTSGLAGQTLNVTIQARGACSVENSLIVQIGPPAPHRRNLLRLLLALW
jgi:hypothetical protein